MRRWLVSALLALAVGPVLAADNGIIITPCGTGCVTTRSKDVGLGVQSGIGILGDTAGNPIYGTAGTANANVLTVQGIASMTKLLVDGSGVTQPVSGTVTANAGTGTFTVGGTVTANQGTSPWTVAGTAAVGATASGNPLQDGGIFNTTPATIVSGQMGALQLTNKQYLLTTITDNSGHQINIDPNGNLNNDQQSWAGTALGAPSAYGTSPGAVTVPGVNAFVTNTVGISGTVTANQGTTPWADNVTQFGGTNIATGTGISGAGIPRVTVSNDSTLADQVTTGSITTTQSVTANTSGQSSVGIQITGTFTGTLVFEASVDGGTTWNATTVVTMSSGAIVSSATAAFAGQANVGGFSGFRVRGNTIATGTATVTLRAGVGISTVMADNPFPVTQSTSPWVDNVSQFGGTNISTGTGAGGAGIPRVTVSNDSQVKVWDGTNQAAVKASGTNAATTDPAIVAAPSTNPSTLCTSVKAVNQTASTDLVTSTNKLHICSIVLVSATAQNLSLTEGTGTTCATGAAALIGGTTASVAVAANGGFSAVSDRAWLVTQTTADHLCLLQSGTGNVSGVITYTDHN